MQTGSRILMGKGISTYLWLQFLLTTASIMASGGVVLDSCMASAPCWCTVDQIWCDSSHLTEIPTFSPTTTHVENLTIFLPANDLTVVPANAFRNVNTTGASRITILFNSNKLYSMHVDAFAGIENAVVELQLLGNKFTGLPMALTTLTRLQRLYMSVNPIITIDPLVTSLMSPSLELFSFYAWNLTAWPYGLNNFRHLSHLIMTGMPCQHLPLDAFNGFGETLTELNLYELSTGSIPSTVCFLRNLKVLTVNGVDYQTQQQLQQRLDKCRELLTNVATCINM